MQSEDDLSEEPDSPVQPSDGAKARSRYFQAPKPRRVDPVAPQADTAAAGDDAPRAKFVILHGDFEFAECPVPTITDHLMSDEDRLCSELVNLVNWSQDTGALPSPGGLLDQSNVFYESRSIVLSEQGKIQKEQDEARQKKSKSDASKRGTKKGR